MSPGRLISSGAQKDLEESDKRRGNTEVRGGKTFPTFAPRATESSFARSFAAQIKADFEAMDKYGLQAETRFVPGEGEVVTKRIAQVLAETPKWKLAWLRIKRSTERFLKRRLRKRPR